VEPEPDIDDPFDLRITRLVTVPYTQTVDYGGSVPYTEDVEGMQPKVQTQEMVFEGVKAQLRKRRGELQGYQKAHVDHARERLHAGPDVSQLIKDRWSPTPPALPPFSKSTCKY